MSKKLNNYSEEQLKELLDNLKQQLEGVVRKRKNLEVQEMNLEHRIKEIQERI